MKILLTLFCTLLVASFIHAQDFTFSPSFYGLEMSASDVDDKKFGFIMENTSDAPITWYWSIDVPEDFPEEWELQICDLRLCYAFGNLKSSNTLPNIIEPGQITNPQAQYVKVKSHGVPGDSYIIFNIYAGEDCTDLIYSTSDIVSSEDLETPKVTIFPNPATDLITFKNDDDVSKVVISSLNGQSVYNANHQIGQNHNVESISSGMYIISLYNEADRLMKMQQLYIE